MTSFSRLALASSMRRWSLIMVLAGLGIAGAAVLQNCPAARAAGAAHAGATLTNEEVGKALDTYGKNTVTNNGHTEYNITVAKGKWNINVLVSLSPNGKVIWLTNSLSTLPAGGKLSAAALANVLKKNSEIGPMFFAVANGSLQLWYPVPNYDLTAESFRADVDALVATVLKTETLWSPEALAGKNAAGEAATPTK